jgi:hypothetical protein
MEEIKETKYVSDIERSSLQFLTLLGKRMDNAFSLCDTALQEGNMDSYNFWLEDVEYLSNQINLLVHRIYLERSIK